MCRVAPYATDFSAPVPRRIRPSQWDDDDWEAFLPDDDSEPEPEPGDFLLPDERPDDFDQLLSFAD